jgi:hypothetical protein
MLAIALAWAAIILGQARPAWADTTINVDPSELPTTVAQAAPQPAEQLSGCDTAPVNRLDQDVWVFKTQAPVHILTFEATFALVDGLAETVSVSADAPTGSAGIADGSVWVAAPAGSSLTSASAEIDADTGTLEIAAACAAPTGPTGAAFAGLPGSSAVRTPATGAAPQSAAVPRQTGSGLAQGASLGAGLVLTALLISMARGRRRKRLRDPEEDDIRRPVIMPRRP